VRDPLAPPPPARHPDAVFLLSLCLFSGVLQLSPAARSSSISDLLPFWLTAAWGVLLVVGATVTLTGVFWRNRVTGLLLEAAGRVMFAPAALIYGGAVIAAAGWSGVLAAAPFFGFAASSGWRIRQILTAIREVREVLATMTWAANHAQDEP